MQKAKQAEVKIQKITVKGIMVKADDKILNRKNKRPLSVLCGRRISIWS